MHSDLRLAWSQFRRHPWFFAGASLSLALGMSVATAVFTVVDAALLRPLPFHDPDRLVQIVETIPQVNGQIDTRLPNKVVAALPSARAFRGVAAWSSGPSGTARVTGGFFSVLGVRAELGRVLNPDDATPGMQSTVLSHRFWARRYGKDSSLIGRQILIGGETRRVVGVMSPSFGFPAVDAWLPLPDVEIESSARTEKDNEWSPYNTFARLADGVSRDAASGELAVIHQREYAKHAWRNVRSARAVPLGSYLVGGIEDQLQVWTSVAILVVLLCAVNFATVALARGMRRRGEIAVRVAMGASAWRIVRFLLAEAFLVATAGGALALLLGSWLLRFVERWFTNGSIVLDLEVSWPTVAFAMLGTVAIGFAFAIAPAVELAKVDLRARLNAESAGTTAKGGELRGRRLLVGLQLTLALCAMAVVGSLLGADRQHWSTRTAIEHRPLIIARIEADSAGLLVRPFLERLRNQPGVSSASVLYQQAGATVWTDDRSANAFYAFKASVSRHYFATIGVRPIAGRMPTNGEINARAPVALLSSQMAAHAFGSDSGALGRRLHIKVPGKAGAWMTVIGVVPEFGGRSLFQLSAQLWMVEERPSRYAALVVRGRGPLEDRMMAIQRARESVGPGMKVTNVVAAQTLVDAEWAERMGRTLFVSSIGVLALLLAIVGVFGLTAYNTEARSREFGIRIALGASRPRIAGSMVREYWPLASIATPVALVIAAMTTRFIDSRYRNPMAEQAFVDFKVVPALTVGAALCVVLAAGMVIPFIRVLRMDVIRAINSGQAS